MGYHDLVDGGFGWFELEAHFADGVLDGDAAAGVGGLGAAAGGTDALGAHELGDGEVERDLVVAFEAGLVADLAAAAALLEERG